MTGAAWLQLVVLIALVVAGTRLLGPYLARVYAGARCARRPLLPPHRAPPLPARGHRPRARAAVARSTRSRCSPSAPSRCWACTSSSASRACLPLNPTDVDGVPPALAFNTAVSFVTNTNWQNYGGESTMSHLTQMAGLTVQNFVSAAVGIAVAVALDPRADPPPQRHDRELLGRSGPHDDSRPAAARDRRRAAAGEPGRRADAARRDRGADGRGAAQQIYRRAGREPGGDQGARARTAAGS